MTTTGDSGGVSNKKRSMGAFVAAIFWTLECCLTALPGAWAQPKSAEPEANPDFQQNVQGPSAGGIGQPMDNAPTAAPTAPAATDQAQSAAPTPVPTSAPSVQIGGENIVRPAAPPEPTNPMDVKVSVRVREAPLATFLEIISNQAKVNFIVTEGLQNKKVTAFLQNVKVREALQILLEIKGLTYQQIGRSNSYIVRERTKEVQLKITRIYTLSFAPLVPLLPTTGRPGGSSFQSAQFGSSAYSSQPGITPGGGGYGVPGQPQQLSPGSGIAIYQIIKSILTKDGQIAIDPRTNSLVITDIPEVFPQVDQIIAELDKKAPQVMIEAQIVEIDSDKTKNLGLEWGDADGTLARFTGPERDTGFPLNLPHNLNKASLFKPVTNIISSLGSGNGANGTGNNTQTQNSGNTTVTSNPVLTGSNLKTGIVDLSSLSVVLRALVSHSEARFLGKPKVMTLNNMPATIEITQNSALAQLVNITGTNGGVSQATTTVERQETGVRLQVTPQVNKEGYITMLIEPRYTNAVESSVSSTSNPVFDPVTRTESTLVRVKNGQTLVLGGLLSSRETKEVRKVPFFGYIPLLGWLFTSTHYYHNNTDLVIFLTPTMISD